MKPGFILFEKTPKNVERAPLVLSRGDPSEAQDRGFAWRSKSCREERRGRGRRGDVPRRPRPVASRPSRWRWLDGRDERRQVRDGVVGEAEDGGGTEDNLDDLQVAGGGEARGHGDSRGG